MNATEIKCALEGIQKATSRTTFSPRDKALLRSLLHTIEFSILACANMCAAEESRAQVARICLRNARQ